jgi:ferrous iron transport protein A
MSILVRPQQAASLDLMPRQPLAGTALEAKAMIKKQQISLADLPVGILATVVGISSSSVDADLALIQRLAEIGFVPGENLKVIAHGHPGREPIAVRIGGTTFALRRFEADYIYVVADA